LLRVVRLHHAFFPYPPVGGRKRKRKKMKESNNADMSGKVQHPPLGVGGILTYYQQLPIKVKLSRLVVQPLIEKGIAHNLVHAVQYRLALRH
jgi:hypothetical protein